MVIFTTALEPRTMTRWDAHAFAREAYNLGIHFIGGCCGFEPYHIRAVAEEVTKQAIHESVFTLCVSSVIKGKGSSSPWFKYPWAVG